MSMQSVTDGAFAASFPPTIFARRKPFGSRLGHRQHVRANTPRAVCPPRRFGCALPCSDPCAETRTVLLFAPTMRCGGRCASARAFFRAPYAAMLRRLFAGRRFIRPTPTTDSVCGGLDRSESAPPALRFAGRPLFACRVRVMLRDRPLQRCG
jgi:hypothetical protein